MSNEEYDEIISTIMDLFRNDVIEFSEMLDLIDEQGVPWDYLQVVLEEEDLI